MTMITRVLQVRERKLASRKQSTAMLTTNVVTSTSSNAAKSTGKSSATKTSAIHKTSYDARLPAGGVSLISPAATSGAQYYKVGDNVTFAWNFTSLSSTPTALNILASCTANHELYTMAMNQTINGNATAAVTWDTAMYSTAAVQLLTETYTLIIYDADSSISAVPQAGYLAPYAQYTFGMYIPQAYTPLAEGFQCVTCSGALSDMEKRALGFMFGMSLITVLSFSWFMGGLNVIW